MAINVYKLIRATFRWGFKKDLVDRDVSAKLDRPAEERRLPAEERTLNDEEVRRLWLGVEALGRETATFIRLPRLCGTRRGETALAEWDEFDLREQVPSVWRVRAEHRKGQRGKKRGLVIPLPPLAVRLLVALREETGRGARVFQSSVSASLRTSSGVPRTCARRPASGSPFMTYARRARPECAG
jgi:integrase